MTEAPSASPSSATGSGRALGQLARHSAIYSLVPIASRAIAILMTPLYTAWLVEAEYGVKEIIDLVLTALGHVVGGNVLSGMVRFYFDQRSGEDREAVISSTTLFVSFVSLGVCALAFPFRQELAPLLLGRGDQYVSSGDLRDLLSLALLILPFHMASECGTQYLIAQRRSVFFSTVMISKLLVQVTLQFFLIGYLGWGVRGFLVSMLVGESLVSVTLTGWILVSLRARIVWRVLRPILLYSAPLIPVGLCQLGLHQLDRRLLEALSPAAEALTWVGIYGLGYKLGYLVCAMILGPFLQIWQPWIFRIEDREERTALTARVSTYAVVVIAFASLPVILFGRQGVELLASREGYELAYKVVPWICTGYVFWALYQTTQVALFIAKRTAPLLWINILALTVNVGLNLSLVPRFGYLGAAAATLGTFLTLAVLGMALARGIASIAFEIGRLTRTLLLLVAAGALAIWLDGQTTTQLLAPILAAKVASWSAFSALLWLSVLDADERRQLRGWLGETARRLRRR